jgi:glucokinase
MATTPGRMLLLAGDIGGTKADLALFDPALGPRAPLARRQFASRDYPDLATIALEFLSLTGAGPRTAVFGVPGPVIDGTVETTNLPWVLSERSLSAALGLESVHVLNDLEATGLAVPILEPADVTTLQTGTPAETGAIALVAPGTGLGEVFLSWDGTRHVAHPSEGGHTDLAPVGERQILLLRYLQRRYGHVSYERVCSGIGIPNIFEFLRETGDWREEELVQRVARDEDPTRVIVAAAVEGSSELCAETMATFVAILGAEAGNLALKVLATGGVYLAGGIVKRIPSLLARPGLLQAFRDKGRFEDLMARIPLHVITGDAALAGAARYGIEFAGRR